MLKIVYNKDSLASIVSAAVARVLLTEIGQLVTTQEIGSFQDDTDPEFYFWIGVPVTETIVSADRLVAFRRSNHFVFDDETDYIHDSPYAKWRRENSGDVTSVRLYNSHQKATQSVSLNKDLIGQATCVASAISQLGGDITQSSTIELIPFLDYLVWMFYQPETDFDGLIQCRHVQGSCQAFLEGKLDTLELQELIHRPISDEDETQYLHHYRQVGRKLSARWSVQKLKVRKPGHSQLTGQEVTVYTTRLANDFWIARRIIQMSVKHGDMFYHNVRPTLYGVHITTNIPDDNSGVFVLNVTTTTNKPVM